MSFVQFVVFLDTNSVNGTSFSSLFGNSENLSKLSKYATLVVPSIVLDELIEHKRRHFASKSTELKKNPLLSEMSLSGGKLDDLKFEDIELRVKSDESIPYTLWGLPQSHLFFDKLLSLAIRNEPPFEASSDKGFKDACIAFTVQDYIDEHADGKCFILVTSDSRLEEYFGQYPHVKVVRSVVDAIAACSRDTVISDAFTPVTNECVGGAVADVTPADTVNSSLIEALCDSASFQMTHEAIQRLLPFRDRLTTGEAVKILQSAANNQQINWILADDDVANFIRPLFDKYSDQLTDDQYRSFVDAAGIPNHRFDEFGNPLLSRSEQYAYQQFADGLVSHIQSVDYPASFEVNPSNLHEGLKRLLPVAAVDNYATMWSDVAQLLIQSSYTISDAPIGNDILKRFIVLLEESSQSKREAIARALVARLDSVDVNLPF